MNARIFKALCCIFFVLAPFDEPNACSCTCFLSYYKVDSLLQIACSATLMEPDSRLVNYLSEHSTWFIGLISAVDSTSPDSETVHIYVDSVLAGNMPQDSLIVQNISSLGDCIMPAKPLNGMRFLGYFDYNFSPQNLHELGITMQDCGTGPRGYLYGADCLIYAETKQTTTIVNGHAIFSCEGPIVTAYNNHLNFTVSSVPRHFARTDSAASGFGNHQYFSLQGKRLKAVGNASSAIIISALNQVGQKQAKSCILNKCTF